MARNVFWTIDPNTVTTNQELEKNIKGGEEVIVLKSVTFRLRPFDGENGEDIYLWFACGSYRMEGYFSEYPFVTETKDY